MIRLIKWYTIKKAGKGTSLSDFDVPFTINTMQASGLQYPLPPNLHLLTLEPVGGSRAIVRLEHLYPGVKDNRLNKPASVSLKVRCS